MHQTVRPRRDGRRARHFEARTSVASFGCERSGGMASSNGGWNGGVPANGGGTMQHDDGDGRNRGRGSTADDWDGATDATTSSASR